MNSLVKEKQQKSIRLPYADDKMKHHNLSKTSWRWYQSTVG